jgi:hypothetical protein
MKRLLLLTILGIGILFISKSTPAINSNPPAFGMQIGFFYSSLSPHGEWIEAGPGFLVWRPFHIHRHWRPYLIGRWMWTDYGWYWMSDEPFGWIVYHYGRWYYDDYYGWVWVPDDLWGPAWVEWRYDDDYIGWAPLPPYATFSVTVGIHFTSHWVAPVHYWNFIKYRHFGKVIQYNDLASEKHTRRLIRTSRSSQQYDIDRDKIINRGIDRSIIEQRGNLRIQRAEVQNVRERSGERLTRSDDTQLSGRIEIYRPSREEMEKRPDRIEAQRGKRNISLDMDKIGRTQRDESRSETRQELTPREERKQERDSQRDGEQRENKPRVKDSQQQREPRQKREEFMERYEQKQNPTPPTNRESSQPKIERRRETTPGTPSSRQKSNKQSERSSEQRRSK